MNAKDHAPDGCPVQAIMDNYKMEEEEIMNVVRLNWRMSVLSILASSEPSGVNYNRIHSITGLNPRTLSIILKELTADKILKRAVSGGSPPRVKYSLTKLGIDVAKAQCPIFDMARSRNRD